MLTSLLGFVFVWRPQPVVTLQDLQTAAQSAAQKHPQLKAAWEPYQAALADLGRNPHVLRSLYKVMSGAAHGNEVKAVRAEKMLIKSQKYIALLK